MTLGTWTLGAAAKRRERVPQRACDPSEAAVPAGLGRTLLSPWAGPCGRTDSSPFEFLGSLLALRKVLRRVSISFSRVRSWQLTPGTSSIHTRSTIFFDDRRVVSVHPVHLVLHHEQSVTRCARHRGELDRPQNDRSPGTVGVKFLGKGRGPSPRSLLDIVRCASGRVRAKTSPAGSRCRSRSAP